MSEDTQETSGAGVPVGHIEFYEAIMPPLKDGDYVLTATQTIEEDAEEPKFVVAVGEWDRHDQYTTEMIVSHMPWCHHIRGVRTMEWGLLVPCKTCRPDRYYTGG